MASINKASAAAIVGVLSVGLAMSGISRAARVYNMTAVAIVVTSRPGDTNQIVALNPGDQKESKSNSVNWSGATDAVVRTGRGGNSRLLCTVPLSADHQLQGGNYFLVTQNDRSVTCTLCDSSQSVLAQASGGMPDQAAPFISPQQSCR